MTACSAPLPRNLLRANTNAVGMPKSTFSGTTIATTSSDSCKRRYRSRRGDRVEERPEPGCERTPQDDPHRHDHQDEDVSEREEPEEMADGRGQRHLRQLLPFRCP